MDRDDAGRGWFAMPDAVDDAGLDPYAYRVLAFLYRHADKAGSSFWSRAKMAAACGLSPRQVTYSLDALRPAWVTWEQRHGPNGGWTANRYTVARAVKFGAPLRHSLPKVVAGLMASPQVAPYAQPAQALRHSLPTKDKNFLEGQEREKPPVLDLDLPRPTRLSLSQDRTTPERSTGGRRPSQYSLDELCPRDSAVPRAAQLSQYLTVDEASPSDRAARKAARRLQYSTVDEASPEQGEEQREDLTEVARRVASLALLNSMAYDEGLGVGESPATRELRAAYEALAPAESETTHDGGV